MRFCVEVMYSVLELHREGGGKRKEREEKTVGSYNKMGEKRGLQVSLAPSPAGCHGWVFLAPGFSPSSTKYKKIEDKHSSHFVIDCLPGSMVFTL